MERTWLNIPAAEYHKLPAVSSGALRCFAKDGPLEYYSKYVAGTSKRKESDPMRLGSAFHRAMEDRNAFDDSYLILPTEIGDDGYALDVNERLSERGSKAKRCEPETPINLGLPSHRMYVECWKDHAAANNKDVLDAEELERVKRMIDSVYDNASIADYLSGGGTSEVAVVSKCPQSGLMVKGLLDFHPPDRRWFLDFKSHCRKTPFEFLRDCEWLGYWKQIASYRYASGVEEHKIVSVYSGPDYYEAMLYDVPWEQIAYHHETNIKHLMQLASLLRDAEGSPKDSQGIPAVFHNEGWGGEIDPQDMNANREPEVRFDE